MPTARLPDGTEVDTASPEWRAHCLAQWQARQPECDRHVATLRRLHGRDERAAYMDRLAAADAAMAERVKAEFLRWFEAEKKRRQDIARRSTPTG
jgi:hypothetical protein